MHMEKPEMEVVLFENEDIVTASGCPKDGCTSVQCALLGCDGDECPEFDWGLL